MNYGQFRTSTINPFPSHFGTDGDDVFEDAAGDDDYFAGAGDDVLRDGEGTDYLGGGDGDDVLHVSRHGQNNFFEGGAGNDTLVADRAFADVALTPRYSGMSLIAPGDWGGPYDAFIDIETLVFADRTFNVVWGAYGQGKISGTSGDDMIFASNAEDTVEGGAGDDLIFGRTGGAEGDLLTYETAASAVKVSLNIQNAAQDTGGAGVDTIWGFRRLVGTAFDDTLEGSSAADHWHGEQVVFGGVNNDTLEGGDGDDVLIGTSGMDVARGGDGNDIHYASERKHKSAFDGGAGIDTLSFKPNGGLRAGYTITVVDGGAVEVKDAAGHYDRITNVEVLEFADGIVSVADVMPEPVPIVLTTGYRGANYFVDASGHVWLRSGANSIPTASSEVAFADGTLYTSQNSTAARVYRLYEAGLDRPSDQAGQSFWTAALENGATLADLAGGFLASPEFATRFGAADAPVEVFVGNLYRNVLGREGDAEGMEYWCSLLVTNAFGRADVLVGFSESLENQRNTAGEIAQGVWVMDKDSPTIARLYDTLLGRNPDEEGLMHWNALIDRGDASIKGIAANFMQLPEYTSRFGGLGNGDFVERLYQATLHRGSDVDGKAAWLQGLDSGALSRADVVLAFSESLEHQILTQERFLSEGNYGITFV